MKTFTVVTRGEHDRGYRWLIHAANWEHADQIAEEVCRRKGQELVGIFPGHMAAVKWITRRCSMPLQRSAAKKPE